MDASIEEITRVAKEELAREQFRARVEEAKIRLRARKSIWQKIFPFKIKIERI